MSLKSSLIEQQHRQFSVSRQMRFPQGQPIWSNLGDGKLIAGRADAVAVRGEEHLAVLDWKSDISPSRDDRSGHIAQLKDYIETIGAPKGPRDQFHRADPCWIQDEPAALVPTVLPSEQDHFSRADSTYRSCYVLIPE